MRTYCRLFEGGKRFDCRTGRLFLSHFQPFVRLSGTSNSSVELFRWNPAPWVNRGRAWSQSNDRWDKLSLPSECSERQNQFYDRVDRIGRTSARCQLLAELLILVPFSEHHVLHGQLSRSELLYQAHQILLKRRKCKIQEDQGCLKLINLINVSAYHWFLFTYQLLSKSIPSFSLQTYH